MNDIYFSYLMGASQVRDEELEERGVTIIEKTEEGSRKLHIPKNSLAQYEQLVAEKLDAGFWNDIVSEDEIIFIFKLSDGTVKRLVYSDETQPEISKLCSQLNGDPIEKTANVPGYLIGNDFYEGIVRRYVFKHLPRKYAAGGGLFLNEKDEILIVKPSYKPGWSIVGGNTDAGETSREAFIRETREEIGLEISANTRLLCVQHVIDTSFRGDNIQFVFDGGVLTQEQVDTLRVDSGEISEVRFVPLKEAVALLGPNLGTRMSAAYAAREEGIVRYIEFEEE